MWIKHLGKQDEMSPWNVNSPQSWSIRPNSKNPSHNVDRLSARELSELLLSHAQKMVEATQILSIDNCLRQRYLADGLNRDIDDLPYLLPDKDILSAITFLYLGLITELESVDEIVIIASGGLILDQPILHLQYKPLLIEMHSNTHLDDDMSLGRQIKMLDDFELLSGKNVLVVDEDYVTGDTLDKVYKLVSGYDPLDISLFTLENERSNSCDYCHKGHDAHYSLFKKDRRFKPETVTTTDFNNDFKNYKFRRNLPLNVGRARVESVLDCLVSGMR